ncbi:MAG: acetyl-CoA carboxylase biotin carboxylase subunit [Saprospiraceae bacterium]|jgi:acetyl-CoA carboxylase biotin carboxylase subunit
MQKILVANRGEIALRVMRTARKMGIQTVAVYSEADRDAPHVLFADQAFCIGPPPSAESYLSGDKILAIAKANGVDGIHPGYGFLSENAEFARKVTESGIIFIGPSPYSMEIMGSKLAAKDAVKDYGIPMVPGIDRAVEEVELAMDIAKEIGFPVLIKASAGGGGKGMRIVEKEEDLAEQMARAISEAISSFGDGAVFIEKYILSPRHIEIQVLADRFGNTVHLFERECSIQRRHQKVVEEAPSAILTPEVRAAMGEAAIKVAKAAKYEGAGTVEFLIDEDLNFYFLEMNTRLQVEHPVTEFITGIDLVEQQINIASGQALSFSQEDLKITGHAVELRVYAEDPVNNFLPSVGKLERYRIPVGEGIRVDDGFKEGMNIPIYYDPMIAKLVTFGSNRLEAIARMKQAIDAFEIKGVETTLPFGRFVMEHEAFLSANFNTHFVQQYFNGKILAHGLEDEAAVAALFAANLLDEHKALLKPVALKQSGWRSRL